MSISICTSVSDSEKRTILPPPLLGEHNEIILKELGYSKDDIQLFEKENVITS